MCWSKPFSPQPTSDSAGCSVEEEADRHVRQLVGFYIHLAAFLGVNAMLVGINLSTSPGVFWAIWPILGWGMKVVAHAVAIFGVPGHADWKDRMHHHRYTRRHADRSAAESDTGTDPPADQTEQLRQRVENLETIVTNADWDLLADLNEGGSPHEQTAGLAKDVVPH